MENTIAITDMADGVDISVYQWFRDDGGFPIALTHLDASAKDEWANAFFEMMMEKQGILNDPIDFKKMATLAKFAFVRAMSNAGAVDKSFELNWTGTRDAGIPRGPYMNWVIGANMLDVVTKFYNTVNMYDLGELPPVLDYEPSKPADPNAILACLGKMNSLFKHPKGVLVYSSLNFWGQIKPTPTWMGLDYIKRWVASWANTPQPTMPPKWPSYEYWQYSAKGDGAAYGVKSKQIDKDRFNGTAITLKTWFRYPPQPEEPSIEERMANAEQDIANLQARVYKLENQTFLNKLFGK